MKITCVFVTLAKRPHTLCTKLSEPLVSRPRAIAELVTVCRVAQSKDRELEFAERLSLNAPIKTSILEPLQEPIIRPFDVVGRKDENRNIGFGQKVLSVIVHNVDQLGLGKPAGNSRFGQLLGKQLRSTGNSRVKDLHGLDQVG